MADRKVVERVEKLLRLAAPSSNTSEHERASAALEAARLVAEHGLTVSGARPPRAQARERSRPTDPYEYPYNEYTYANPWWTNVHNARRTNREPPPPPPDGDWQLVTVHSGGVCACCRTIYSRWDRVWVSGDQARHNYPPCNAGCG